MVSAEQPPGPHPVEIPPEPVGLRLNGQQRALLEALQEIDQMLGEMYLGALAVLNQPFNGERFAQSAHTLRELINHLPASLGLTSDALTERLRDRLQRPEQVWGIARQQSQCFNDGTWSGTIDRSLARALTAIEEFFRWKSEHFPRRREELTKVVRRLDASGRRLPAALENLAVTQWDVTRDYFISVCHHHNPVNEADFFAYFDAFERFILDRLRPRTFADFDALDRIIEEAGHGD
jgi:hypothetical protein